MTTIVSPVIFSIAGASLAYALAVPVQFGVVAGLALGVTPLLARLFPNKITAVKIAARLNLVLLTTISAVVSYLILFPLLNAESVDIKQNLPLLLATVALYIYYLLLSRTLVGAQDLTLLNKLTLLFSGPTMMIAFIMSITVSTYLLLTLHYMQLNHEEWELITNKFLKRGIIPPITVFLFFWGLLMLANKFWVLWRERQMLNTANGGRKSVLMQTYYQNLQEQGETSPQNYLDLIWKKSAEFYILPRYINWAIPILGFIGTVLGISLAAEGIQRIISKNQGLTQLSSDLGQAITPLGIAFDTTLIALSLSVVLTLAQTLLQRWEDNLLIDYESRIRKMPISNL